MISRKTIYALVFVVGSVTLVTPTQSANAVGGLIDATVSRLNKSIERLEALKAKEQEKVDQFKAKVEQAKTKAEEVEAKVDLKKAEAVQKKVEVEQKIEEKKLEWKQSVEAEVLAKKVAVDQKLTDKKLEICNKQVTEINDSIDKMNARREENYQEITKASTAIQKFYEYKHLAIENYPVLIAATETAQSAAEISKARQVSTVDFDCGTDKPNTYLSLFHDNRKESVDAIVIYRQSVKDLLTAVRDAAKADAVAAKQIIKETRE
ncbi:MAG: hypothetical protein WAW80_01115 [Candidatus Saccharimonadales bacterium]